MAEFDHHGICPNCGSETVHFAYVKYGAEVVRCSGTCGLIWHSDGPVDARRDKANPACSVCNLPFEKK